MLATAVVAVTVTVAVVGTAVLSTVFGFGSTADLLRLAVVPAFAWAAYRDVLTRRVPNRLWPPLVAVGVLALALDFADGLPTGFQGELVLLRLAVSVGLVAPLGYVFYRIGGFGGADAKAVLALAVVFPLYPVYYLPFDALPMHAATLGVFSLTILTNTVVAGALYPAALAVRNLLAGRLAPPMIVGRPTAIGDLTTAYGSLLETPEGYTRRGLDLDALRMYLRWRGTTLSALREAPDRHRDPSSIPSPAARNDPGDGAVADGPPVADGGTHDLEPEPEREPEWESERESEPKPASGSTGVSSRRSDGAPDTADAPDAVHRGADERSDEGSGAEADLWGAEAFLADVEGTAYGTTPTKLRDGLDVIADSGRETVWVTPGIPFVVPMFVGLVVALTYGDVLFVVLQVLGLLP